MTKTNEIRNNTNAAINELLGKFEAAKQNARVIAGDTKEDFMERCDESINVMHGAFGSFLDILDMVTGYQGLKDSISYIVENEAGTSKKSLNKMAKRCRQVIDAKIAFWSLRSDSPEFKKAVQLKAIIEIEDDKGQCILSAFVSGLLWIAKKVARKLRSWLKVDDEKSIIGAVCRSLSGFAHVLRAGLHIVWNTAKFAVSFVVAGVAWVVDIVCKAISTAVSKAKGFAATARDKFSFADEDEDFFDEEELEAEEE